MNIFQRFRVRPAEGATMMRVPGDYKASVELDVSELTASDRNQLIRELEDLGLTVRENAGSLKVSGPVVFEFSRGTDQEGRKALWLSASGPIVELIGQSLAYVYVPKGWQLSTGRVMREILSRVGGEVRLPDGTLIFIGASEEYNQSLLASDGSMVHPKFSDPAASNATVEIIEDDPFK